METVVVAMDKRLTKFLPLKKQVAVRTMTADVFIEQHASGTLRKNKRLGMVWREQYLTERTSYEFGWGFKCLPRSRVTFGDAYTEGDVHGITEAGWHIERYIQLSVFPEDRFETKYISVEHKDGTRSEGIGMIVRETSASFVPPGHIVFAIVTAFDPIRKEWREAENPR